MKKFIVKAAKPKPSDPFYISESEDFIFFFCNGLSDLRNTIRVTTPKGYRVKNTRWWAKQMSDGYLCLKNPFFKTIMFEVKAVEFVLNVEKKVDYTNSFGFKHLLKLVSSKDWEQSKNDNILSSADSSG